MESIFSISISLKVVSNQYYKLKINIYKKILIFILQKFQYLFDILAFISKCHNQVLICIFKIKKIDMIKKKMKQIYQHYLILWYVIMWKLKYRINIEIFENI